MTQIPIFAIVVYWCSATTPIGSFNPHQLDAVAKFVAANPATCHASPPEQVEGPKTLQECRSRAMLSYMPGWLQKNEGRLYLGADCFERRPDPLDLEAMKKKVRP